MLDSSLKTWYSEGVKNGWIGLYEQEMVRFLEQETGALSEEEVLCLVFVSLFVKAGHVYLPLDRSPKEWATLLGVSGALAENDLSDQPIQIESFSGSTLIGEREDALFVLDNNRLFMNRYRLVERSVARALSSRSSGNDEDIRAGDVLPVLDSFFSQQNSPDPDYQKVAVALALVKKFLLISGGPGTGKTTTVAKIVALLIQCSRQPVRVALAAPTGKAAARMGETLNELLAGFSPGGELFRYALSEAKTVHRLLRGFDSDGLLPPATKKVLPYDLVIIDEASMIDLTLMHRLLRHLGDQTRLILLGDRYQLASVEAGAVLADICQKEGNGFNPETAEMLSKEFGIGNLPVVVEQSPLDDSIVYLEKSWRFDEKSGIGRLANAVKKQTETPDSTADFQAKQPLFNTDEYPDLHYVFFSYRKEDLLYLFEEVAQRLRGSGNEPVDKLFYLWQKEIWLTVLRFGPFGTEMLNRLIENHLIHHGVVKPVTGWYHGRPVLVTRNDYQLGIYNGDMGVCVLEENSTAWICFPDSDEGFKRIRADRIRHIEPAFVLTVHKSQGSEFDHVHLLLPNHDTPILTRELIYTAVTRAKKSFTLYGSLDLFRIGIGRKILRFTGLADRLRESEQGRRV